MKCKQAKTQIALWVGNDLEEAAQQKLRGHLTECPECREHSRQLKVSLRALESVERMDALVPASVWPNLSVRLAGRRVDFGMNRFNGWVAAVAVAASALAMFSISLTSNEPQRVYRLDDAPFHARGVGNPLVPDLSQSSWLTAPESSPLFDDTLPFNPRRFQDRQNVDGRSSEAPKSGVRSAFER
jgi:hypothetical protein